MRKIIRASTLLILVVVLAACSSKTTDQASNAESGKVTLKYHAEPGVVTPAELAEDLGYFEKVELKNSGVTKGGPESIQYVATNQIDFGNAFNGAIIKSIDKGVKIKGVVTSYGSTNDNYIGFFTKKGSEIKEAKDLIGKKIAVNILGAHLELAIQEYLYNGGLTKEEVKQVELITLPTINAEQSLLNGQVDVVGLSSIFRDKAIENGDVELLFTDTEAFNAEYNAGSYFFKEDFIKDNEGAIKDFTAGVAKAFDWTASNDREVVIERLEKIMTERNLKEPVENLKYWKNSSVSSNGGIIRDSDYERWIAGLKRAGDLTEDLDTKTMFTNKYNPFK